MKDVMAVAEAAWGPAMPDWVRALARACARSSQAKVAADLDRSDGAISQVLNNKYGADTARIEERVRGLYLDGRVACPALGEIRTNVCQDWRDKSGAFEAGSPPLRRSMFRACGRCPRNRKDADDER